jgi:ADP-L-glycero-D-manno-heptose 6-epimerase
MIVVTGGSGFIGSALVWALNRRGIEDIIVVDEFTNSGKWRNLVPLRFSECIDKDGFIEALERGVFHEDIEAIFHMGACSSTLETDSGYLMENNYRYSVRLAMWWQAHASCRFIYASSAATYGNGENGYDDDERLLDRLRPLNAYAFSKHRFDVHARRKGWLAGCVGLKYFNVFGPNEYHKENMRSVILKAYPGVRETGKISLFKSHREGYADGEQRRDFLYVKDAVAQTLFFLDNKDRNGIYNIGTGTARSWNEVAHAMFTASGMAGSIEYIPMPGQLDGVYQYYTCANVKKLQASGCAHRCMGLEESIYDYITRYLDKGLYLGME